MEFNFTTEFESGRVATLRRCRNGVLCIAALMIAACGDNDGSDFSVAGSASQPSHAGSTNPRPNQPPEIQGKPGEHAMVDQAYRFSPTAVDPEGDDVSFRAFNLPRWASFNKATGHLYGTPSEADAGYYSNIDIEVSDGDEASRLGTFAIEVMANASGAIAISWIPATERVDGSPLTNLMGHRIYWGTEPGAFPFSKLVNGAGVTAHVIENLLPGAYYIAATTIDINGLESELSGAVNAIVQ